MSTFLGKTMSVAQLGANSVEFRFTDGGVVYLSPSEAVAMGKWLMTVQVPEVKPETGREIDLKEIGLATPISSKPILRISKKR